MCFNGKFILIYYLHSSKLDPKGGPDAQSFSPSGQAEQGGSQSVEHGTPPEMHPLHHLPHISKILATIPLLCFHRLYITPHCQEILLFVCLRLLRESQCL